MSNIAERRARRLAVIDPNMPPYRVTDSRLTEGDVVELQKLDCQHRNRCLTVAQDWSAMQCFDARGRACAAYESMDKFDQACDIEPLIRMAGMILR